VFLSHGGNQFSYVARAFMSREKRKSFSSFSTRRAGVGGVYGYMVTYLLRLNLCFVILEAAIHEVDTF
jgi:hypothetical protein